MTTATASATIDADRPTGVATALVLGLICCAASCMTFVGLVGAAVDSGAIHREAPGAGFQTLWHAVLLTGSAGIIAIVMAAIRWFAADPAIRRLPPVSTELTSSRA